MAAANGRGEAYEGPHPVGSQVDVEERDGILYIKIAPLGPSEVLVLLNAEG